MVVVLTGASSGIGFAAAQGLAEKGHVVYGLSRTCAATATWQQFEVDVTDPSALELVVQDILGQHGHIDVLILCAGVGLASPSDKMILKEGLAGNGEEGKGEEDLGPARFLFDVNFFGVAEMVRLCLPSMKQVRRGRIIIVSSMAGIFPLPYQSFYSASKAALCAYTAALTAEVRPFGVHVTALLPGGVRTPFTKRRRRMEGLFGDPRYPGYENAVLTISKEEGMGMTAGHVAAVIVELVARRNPPALRAVGGKYRLLSLVVRLLPMGIVLKLLRRKYVGKPG